MGEKEDKTFLKRSQGFPSISAAGKSLELNGLHSLTTLS